MTGTLHASTIGADTALKGDRVTSVTARRQAVTVDRLDAPADWLDYFKTNHCGPTIGVHRSIAVDPERFVELDRALITFASRQAGDGGAMEWEYLMLTTRRT